MSRETRLGIAIGFGAALLLLAWRIVEELRADERGVPEGWIAVQQPAPDGPLEDPLKSEGGATAWDWALLFVLLVAVALVVIVLAAALVAPR